MNKFTGVFRYCAIIFCACLTLFPVLFMFANSFMSEAEIISRYTTSFLPTNFYGSRQGDPIHFVQLSILPAVVSFEGYAKTLLNPLYLRLYWNSIIIVLPIVFLQCAIAAPAALAFEELKWRFKEGLFLVYIVVMRMPLQVLLVPHFIVAETFSFNGTYWAVILPAIFNPFGVFLIRQQLKGFGKEYSEAARIDGATEWRVFLNIIVPNIKPTIAALCVLNFAEYWNVVDQAVVFIRDAVDEPLSVYLSRIIVNDMGMVFAVSCVYMIPAMLFFLIGQDYLAYGISLSSVKS